MTRIEASAPGKVVLCGEYAVLEEAPAIGMAVNRRAVAAAAETDDDWHAVATPGLRDGSFRFRCGGGRFEWLEKTPPRDLDLVERLWLRLPPGSAKHWSLSLDTRAFSDTDSGRKLGLGASAAIATALAAVLARLAGDERLAAVHAAEAHREFQRGHGSGVDVATSVSGGIVEFHMACAGSARRLAWPSPLHCRFLWSGRTASTVDTLAAWRARDADRRAMDALKRAAVHVLGAWRDRDGARVLDALRDYTGVLRRFDEADGLGIFAAGHAELADIAASMGIVYKPCGAGGGDVGAVFARDRALATEFLGVAVDRGFTPLELSLDDNGIRYVNTAPR